MRNKAAETLAETPLETLLARSFEENGKLPAGGVKAPKNALFSPIALAAATYVSSEKKVKKMIFFCKKT